MLVVLAPCRPFSHWLAIPWLVITLIKVYTSTPAVLKCLSIGRGGKTDLLLYLGPVRETVFSAWKTKFFYKLFIVNVAYRKTNKQTNPKPPQNKQNTPK